MTHEIQETLITALQEQRRKADADLGDACLELNAAIEQVSDLELKYDRCRRFYDLTRDALDFVVKATPSS